MRTHIYTNFYIHTYIFIHIHTDTYTYIETYVYMHVNTYISKSKQVYTSVCITSQCHTLIYYDAPFDTNTILVIML